METELLTMKEASSWPALPPDLLRETQATLHMWMQVAGKVALAVAPGLNHYWNVAMRITPRGIATQSLSYGDRAFAITFDFIDQQLVISASDGVTKVIPLESRSVKDFYHLLTESLRQMGIHAPIWPMPVEVPDPVRFDRDEIHHIYDPHAAHAFWRALLVMTPVFEVFRSRFLGKSSPVHFFWGSLDLASTRFSGRRAPERPGADRITKESYSHELISHGFWPGSGPVQEPAFYAYAVPEPAGFKEAVVHPWAAHYNKDLAEFILPYAAVQQSASPETALLAFLESTYNSGADLGKWDRASLEREE
jgi:hypothetical protein